MGDIQNDLTWSFTRQQVFAACRRQYWYRYYAFWGGWDSRAPELARQAYLFSKMMSLPMLIGGWVHRTIEQVLRSHAAGRPLADPVEWMRAKLNAAWKDSRDERWRELGPKAAPPLFEHHYDVAVPREQLERLRATAIAAVESLLASDLFQRILAAGPERWRWIEELADLPIAGVRSFVSPDFAFDEGDETWLLDWKTGGERPDMELQLLAYALFARERWGVSSERLRAFDVFLPEVRLAEVEVTDERLAAAADAIASQITAMQEVLEHPAATEARRENLVPTTDPRECRRCFFQEICDEQPQAATAG